MAVCDNDWMDCWKEKGVDAMYQIEDGIQITRGPNGRKSEYPMRTMEVGQSFLAGGKTIENVTSIVQYYQRKLAPKRFSCRTVDGGVRVWRVA